MGVYIWCEAQCVLDHGSKYLEMDSGLGHAHIPSNTALSYLNGNVKVKEECDLPVGAHLRMRKTMEQIKGYKWCKLDLMEAYDQFYLQQKRVTRDTKQMTCSGVRTSKLKPGIEYKTPMDPIHYHNKQCPFGPVNTRCPIYRSKPGAGLGWMEPRMESFLGLLDRRRTLRGYIGGVKIRESQFAEK